MNYIIFDLELNSKPFKNNVPNEIIEIGAVKLSDKLEVLDTFQSFVKPKVYKKIFSVVKKKTNISQKDITDAQGFKTVIASFKKWIGNDYTLCSWGNDDIHHFKTNCKFNGLKSRWVDTNIDIQKYFSLIYLSPKGSTYSLKDALSVLEIEVNEELHRADIDAKYTAKIFVKTFDQIIEFKEMQKMEKDIVKLQVDGMSCSHCENAVKRVVGELDGVSDVAVDLKEKTVTIQCDLKKITVEQIKTTIEEEGYDVK